jgi:DNA-binding MarR family transcriptional regulator
MTNFRELLELFREHQRASLFVETAVKTEVSLLEIYVLVELDRDPSLPIRDLAHINNVDEDSVARAIRRLRKRRMIKSAPLEADGRRRENLVTELGQKALRSLEETSRSFLKPRLKGLSIAEIAELQSLIHDLCNGANAPKVELRPADHPFDQGIRRITRGFGFVGKSLFGSGHSSTTWQILWAITEGSGDTTLSQLHKSLGIHTSTLSQLCQRYQRNGWLTQTEGADDRRKRRFSLTDSGAHILEEIEQHGEVMCLGAFPEKDSSAGQRLIDLFAKYVRQGGTRRDNVLRPAVELIELRLPAERNDARTFMVFHLLRSGRIGAIPERLAPREGNTFGLRQADKLIAVLDLESWQTDNTDNTVTGHLFVSEAGEDLSLLVEFIAAATAQLNAGRIDKPTTIRIARETLASELGSQLDRLLSS